MRYLHHLPALVFAPASIVVVAFPLVLFALFVRSQELRPPKHLLVGLLVAGVLHPPNMSIVHYDFSGECVPFIGDTVEVAAVLFDDHLPVCLETATDKLLLSGELFVGERFRFGINNGS
jgi:hypothetical protein